MKNYRKLTMNSISRVVRIDMTHRDAYEAVALDMAKRGNPLSRWGGADECIRAELNKILR